MNSLHALFRSRAMLARALCDSREKGAILLPIKELSAELAQYAALDITLECEGQRYSVRGELLQRVEGLGLVVRLIQTEALDMALEGVTPAAEEAQPLVSCISELGEVDEAASAINDEESPPTDEPHGQRRPPAKAGRQSTPGMGPLSWPIEKVQARFSELSLADKVRLAKYGRRPVRSIVLRTQDKQLHGFLLLNSRISADEVAVLAGMANADVALLKRIAARKDWLRNSSVARNLVCNPKMTLPQVKQLLNYLADDELRRLARSGRVRAPIKREMIKRLERRR